MLAPQFVPTVAHSKALLSLNTAMSDAAYCACGSCMESYFGSCSAISMPGFSIIWREACLPSLASSSCVQSANGHPDPSGIAEIDDHGTANCEAVTVAMCRFRDKRLLFRLPTSVTAGVTLGF